MHFCATFSVFMADVQTTLNPSFTALLLLDLEPAEDHIKGTSYIVEDLTNKVLFLWWVNKVGDRYRLLVLLIFRVPGDEKFLFQDFVDFRFRYAHALQTPIPKLENNLPVYFLKSIHTTISVHMSGSIWRYSH